MRLTLSSIEYCTKGTVKYTRAMRVFAALKIWGKSRMSEEDAKKTLKETGWFSRDDIRVYMAWLIEKKWVRMDKKNGLLFLSGLNSQINRFGKTKRQRVVKIDPLKVADAKAWHCYIWGLHLQQGAAEKRFCETPPQDRGVYGSTINCPSKHVVSTGYSLTSMKLRNPEKSMATLARRRKDAGQSDIIRFEEQLELCSSKVQQKFKRQGKKALIRQLLNKGTQEGARMARSLVIRDGLVFFQLPHKATFTLRVTKDGKTHSDDGRYTSRDKACNKRLFNHNGWPQNTQTHA